MGTLKQNVYEKSLNQIVKSLDLKRDVNMCSARVHKIEVIYVITKKQNGWMDFL